MSQRIVSALAAALVLSLAPRATARCATWTPGFGSLALPETLSGNSTCAGFDDGSGVTRCSSASYRNASTTFCPPANANVTNGLRVLW